MNFQNQIDFLPTMFDDFIIPQALDRETVISNIVKRCGLLTPLYSEPYMTKAALDLWFSSNQWTLSHLINVIDAEYSPIENVDRHDQQTREIGRDLNRSEEKTRNGSETRNTDADTSVNASNEAVDSVSPYDTDDWRNSSKRDENNSSTTSMSGIERVTDSNSEAAKGGENEKTLETFKQHMHGNIGVTTNQQMINQELDLLQRFHIYEWIAIEIQSELFLSLY